MDWDRLQVVQLVYTLRGRLIYGLYGRYVWILRRPIYVQTYGVCKLHFGTDIMP